MFNGKHSYPKIGRAVPNDKTKHLHLKKKLNGFPFWVNYAFIFLEEILFLIVKIYCELLSIFSSDFIE